MPVIIKPYISTGLQKKAALALGMWPKARILLVGQSFLQSDGKDVRTPLHIYKQSKHKPIWVYETIHSGHRWLVQEHAVT